MNRRKIIISIVVLVIALILLIIVFKQNHVEQVETEGDYTGYQ